MNPLKIAAVVLILGSILFQIAAFSPISMAFFTESDSARRLEIALNSIRAWVISQILFTSGAVVAAIGIGLAAHQLRNLPGSALAYVGFAAIAVGATLWVWHGYLRAGDPQALVEGTIPAWLFSGYTLLTQAGLAMFGVVLLRSAISSWVGWTLIGGVVICFVIYLVLKDMPPFVYYILTLLVGIMLYGVE